MVSNPPSSFALRPMPHGDRRPKNLGEFIGRVTAERNGFRNVTEEILHREIESEANSIVESKEADMTGAEAEDDKSEDQIQMEDIHKAVGDVRMQAEHAYHNAMLTLDFVSLLLTKDNPNLGGATLSPRMREAVGIGVLGADKLAASNVTEQRLQDNKLVASGWKFADIDRSVDSLLTSASRLQKEITVETRYWAEVLGVSDKGWAVTRVPNEPDSLGVRYGFSEAAPDFRNTSLAPMRRGQDGAVDLDCGRMLDESQRLLVTLEKNGRVVGRSSLPKPLAQEAPLEYRVLEARNTIFAQELWHEMNREGRLLLAYGVRLEESAVSYSLDGNTRVVFSLQPLERAVDDAAPQPLPEDHRAESLSAALHQLLTYAHRINNQRLSRSSFKNRNQSTTTPPYYLLRPVLAHLQHEKSMEDATRFISDLTTILQSAGISTAMFKLIEPPISLNKATTRGSQSEALVQALFGPLEFQFELNITPEARLLIPCRTILGDIISTNYLIYLLPPPAHGETNPLQTGYPPWDQGYREWYTLADLEYYLQQAVARVLVDRASKLVHPTMPLTPPDSEGDEVQAVWIRHINGVALENAADQREQLSFEVAVPQPAATLVEGASKHPELRVHSSWVVAGQPKLAQRTWTWTVEDAVQGVEKDNIEQVVKDVVARVAQPSS